MRLNMGNSFERWGGVAWMTPTRSQVGRCRSWRVGAQTTSRSVLPIVARASMAAWASAARSSGKRWPMTGEPAGQRALGVAAQRRRVAVGLDERDAARRGLLGVDARPGARWRGRRRASARRAASRRTPTRATSPPTPSKTTSNGPASIRRRRTASRAERRSTTPRLASLPTAPTTVAPAAPRELHEQRADAAGGGQRRARARPARRRRARRPASSPCGRRPAARPRRRAPCRPARRSAPRPATATRSA